MQLKQQKIGLARADFPHRRSIFPSATQSGLNHLYLVNSLPKTAANQGYFQAMICNVAHAGERIRRCYQNTRRASALLNRIRPRSIVAKSISNPFFQSS